MKVIGLERGPRLKTEDFNPHDELRYFLRQRPTVRSWPLWEREIPAGPPCAPHRSGDSRNASAT